LFLRRLVAHFAYGGFFLVCPSRPSQMQGCALQYAMTTAFHIMFNSSLTVAEMIRYSELLKASLNKLQITILSIFAPLR
jgi:hypothetical protein